MLRKKRNHKNGIHTQSKLVPNGCIMVLIIRREGLVTVYSPEGRQQDEIGEIIERFDTSIRGIWSGRLFAPMASNRISIGRVRQFAVNVAYRDSRRNVLMTNRGCPKSHHILLYSLGTPRSAASIQQRLSSLHGR